MEFTTEIYPKIAFLYSCSFLQRSPISFNMKFTKFYLIHNPFDE
ncbi:hypothetical protein LLB_1772 [Legionella longbeachae D-4968]|nr:hypothetical protein LLB_1772 [Legionella longbeachae D-4968]